MAAAPTARRRRRAVSVAVAALVGAPMALLPGGSSQAAPTLTVAEAEAQLAALQTQEDVAVEAYDAGQIAATASRAAAAAAQAAVVTQGRRLAAMQAGIASFAVSTYEGTALDPTETLLAGGDPATVVARADDLDQVADVHRAQLTAITAQQQVLTNARSAATQRASAATAALEKLAAAKAKVDGLVAAQQQVVSHLQAQARAALLAQQAAERAAAVRAAQAAAAAQRAAAQAASRASRTVALPVAVSSSAASSPPSAATVPGSDVGAAALRAAETREGDEYVYGAAGPTTFDCSGLVVWAFAQVGVSLPHSAAAQMGYGTSVARGDLQPGDLVFYDEDGTIGHVGIYVGDGDMIDANHTGGWVGVRPLYGGYAGARRL